MPNISSPLSSPYSTHEPTSGVLRQLLPVAGAHFRPPSEFPAPAPVQRRLVRGQPLSLRRVLAKCPWREPPVTHTPAPRPPAAPSLTPAWLVKFERRKRACDLPRAPHPCPQDICILVCSLPEVSTGQDRVSAGGILRPVVLPPCLPLGPLRGRTGQHPGLISPSALLGAPVISILSPVSLILSENETEDGKKRVLSIQNPTSTTSFYL